MVHRDHLSSPRRLTRAVSGTPLAATIHWAFGERIVVSGAAALDTHGYIGEREDAELGLVYLNARVYDPKMGRFLSPDSLDPSGNASDDSSDYGASGDINDGHQSTTDITRDYDAAEARGDVSPAKGPEGGDWSTEQFEFATSGSIWGGVYGRITGIAPPPGATLGPEVACGTARYQLGGGFAVVSTKTVRFYDFTGWAVLDVDIPGHHNAAEMHSWVGGKRGGDIGFTAWGW
ncbi:RHS repeat-associated core domain-containing protein [Microvirga flavescens]|uniref:RHS repeat-associated core domain-containing protein n=1 Tax=Microvirga flavescens TaxID=2249811 RepID=UPI0013007C79|nr:RHS repeat-associated core domain-containing protein [Microvirga flavescens]